MTMPIRASTPRTNRPAALSISGSRSPPPTVVMACPSSRLDSAGITVTATTSDSSTETESATAISRNSWPAGSSSSRTGMNTTTVVTAEARIAPQT